ncbi:MAG: cytochrome P450 [Chloroflexota bacterium]
MSRIEHATPKQIPKASFGFVLKNIGKLRGDRMGIFLRLVEQYGDATAVQLGPVLLHVFNHPSQAQHILQWNQKNYIKDRLVTAPVEIFSGRTMFTSDGQSWLQKRRLMSPAFHRRRLANFGAISASAAARLLERWRQEGTQPYDMQVEMARVTLEVVGLALFSIDLTDEATELGAAFMEGNDYIIYRIDVPFAPPIWAPTKRNKRFVAAKTAVDDFLYDLIEARSKPGANDDKNDLLAMILDARDEETGEGMPQAQVRNELVSLFSAGHDTTASTLMWTLYLLSQHPDVEAKLQAEVDAVLGDRLVTFDDLPQLIYTRQVIDESLRLYPPAWALTRTAVSDDNVAGWHVPAGKQVTLSVAAMHRHPDFWEDPDRFIPERFEPEQAKKRHKFAYIPFGGGPRMCIGFNFALTEATLILATLIRQAKFRLVPGHPVETKTVVGLHARHGMPMTVKWRQ